uniref:Uncharacterized protein n=1 Tax=Arundo donax TaxID=35708 RepID=A0A0A9AWT6_ARUDO
MSLRCNVQINWLTTRGAYFGCKGKVHLMRSKTSYLVVHKVLVNRMDASYLHYS